MLIPLQGIAQSKVQKDSIVLARLLKRNVKCVLPGGKIPQGHKNQVRDAAYAYHYWYPVYFIEKHWKRYSDTEEYRSPDTKCMFRLWPGQTIDFPLGRVDLKGKPIGIKLPDMIRVEKAVDSYIAIIKAGKEKYVGNLVINYLCKGTMGWNFQIVTTGSKEGFGYIYKIDVSELPVSGDLIFKHFLFKYDLGYAAKYQSLGIAMANDFAEF